MNLHPFDRLAMDHVEGRARVAAAPPRFDGRKLVADLERRAKARGISIRAIVRAAGINVSTWTRWKSGQTTPTFRVWDRLVLTADAMLGASA